MYFIYFQGTRNDNSLDNRDYVDSNYARDTSVYVFTLFGGVIHWMRK